MANYQSIIADINSKITTNGQNEITGEVLNSVLRGMVSTLGEGYQFGGLVSPSSAFTPTDAKMVFLAVQEGTYSNFDGFYVPHGYIAVFKYDSTWTQTQYPLSIPHGIFVVNENDNIQDQFADIDTFKRECSMLLVSDGSSIVGRIIPSSTNYGWLIERGDGFQMTSTVDDTIFDDNETWAYFLNETSAFAFAYNPLIVIYNQTPYSAIKEAIDNGRGAKVVHSGFELPYQGIDANGTIYFQQAGIVVQQISVTKEGSWAWGTTELVTKS